jgi:hypothetical protein
MMDFSVQKVISIVTVASAVGAKISDADAM